MNKPVGGRGKVAKYPTIMRRIPEGIKEAVERLSDLYRSSVWDGRVDNLNSNLISGNDPQGNLVKEKPDIKYKEAECHRQLKEAKASIKKLERQIKAQAEHIHQLRTYAGTLYVVVLDLTHLIGKNKLLEPERVSLNSSRD